MKHRFGKYAGRLTFGLILILFLTVVCGISALAGVLTLPDDLKTIEAEAFYGDTSVTEVILPEGLTTIGSKAFANSNVKWIYIPASVTSIADDAFSGIGKTAPYVYPYIKTPANSYAAQWSAAHDPVYPVVDGVAEIRLTREKGMAVGSSLDSSRVSVLPSSAEIEWIADSDNIQISPNGKITVTDEGEAVISFRDVSGKYELNRFQVLPVFLFYAADEPGDDDMLYDPGNNYAYVRWVTPKAIDTGNAMGGWEVDIARRRRTDHTQDTLFINAVGLGSWTVSVPEGADWIHLSTESGTADKITIPDIYTLDENDSPYSRSGIIRFSLGKYTYDYEIEQPGNGEPVVESPLEWFTFSDNGDGTCTLTGYAGPAENDANIVIPHMNGNGLTVTGIGSEAFSGTNGLTGSVTIPYGVTEIGSWAFSQSTITGIKIPSTVCTIGNSAFWNCNGISELRIPEGVTDIEQGAFQHCFGLAAVYLPESVGSIGTDAFGNIDSLLVFGARGSYAETWAQSRNLTFRDLSEMDFSESTVRANMLALQDEYYEGRPWTNNNVYAITLGSMTYNGGGCVAFCYILSDATFSGLPMRELHSFTYDEIRVGDFLRINGNTHSVIVLEKYADHVVIAEGNYNSSIHWGRTLTKEQVEAADYVTTRYPE